MSAMKTPAPPEQVLVEVILEDPRWEAVGGSGGGLETLAERAARGALEFLGLEPAGFEIALLAASDARIAELNADFRGKPQPTNVLSWPAEERGPAVEGAAPMPPAPGEPGLPESLGDIALAWETCMREAQEAGKPLADHLTHLVVHATLHLLGYDHERDGDATLMEDLERKILARLGVADPYGEAAGERIA
jgi:probable rRNA maturation factor